MISVLKEGVEKSAVVAVDEMKGKILAIVLFFVWLTRRRVMLLHDMKNKEGGLGLGEIDELNIGLVCLKCLKDI